MLDKQSVARQIATLLAILLSLSATLVVADDSKDSESESEVQELTTVPLKGSLDFNTYYDSRDFSVLTLNLPVSLPGGFQYFSLTNYFNAIGADKLGDATSFYSEQNLRWTVSKDLPIDLTAQWVIRSPEQNDMLRFGTRVRFSDTSGLERLFDALNMSYSANFHLYQMDFVEDPGYRWQIEHVYRIKLFPRTLGGRVYLGGFIDHNLWFGGPRNSYSSRLVTEHQIGVRLVGQLHGVVEWRRNEFLGARKNGVGFGIEYVIPVHYAQ